MGVHVELEENDDPEVEDFELYLGTMIVRAVCYPVRICILIVRKLVR